MSTELIAMKVTGLAEVNAFFDRAPKLIAVAGLGKALKAAGDVFMAALTEVTPVGMIGESVTVRDVGEHLAASLVYDLVLDSGGRGGYIEVGYGKEGYRAEWVEYGHHMVGHLPDKKPLGEVKPHPFMRPAFEAAADRAIEAFAESIVASVEKGF